MRQRQVFTGAVEPFAVVVDCPVPGVPQGDLGAQTGAVALVEGDQAVVAGIAFLGAGAIIQGRGRVTGITTGASLWVAGAIGIASGLGRYALAGLTTVLAFVILYFLGRLETRLKKDGSKERQ